LRSLLIGAAVFIAMAIEAARASRNERTQRARGGIEPPNDVYKMMRAVYPAAFCAMVAEGMWRGAPARAWFIGGALLFVAAKSLKWWAITALGDFWTFRVIVVPGARLVRTGPYRVLRHPNYVAVAGELIAVALMTGALVSGPIATIAFGVLMLKRIAVEERAIEQISNM